MTQTQLEQWFQTAGITHWGSVSWGALLPFLSTKQGEDVERFCPNPTGAWVAAFPYFAGEEPGNLSHYARGRDYHQVVVERLTPVCQALEAAHPGYTFHPSADNSPLPEVEAALLSGLGVRGKHTLLITPQWGSYVFLGTILTNFPWAWPESRGIFSCNGCNLCVNHCPGGALSADGLDESRCLSALTQYKGELSPTQTALIANHPYVWGCDTCQGVCPHNRGAIVSPLPEFLENRCATLEPDQLEGLTNRQFRENFPHSAFTWRGVAVLRRNFEMQKAGIAVGMANGVRVDPVEVGDSPKTPVGTTIGRPPGAH